MKHTKAMALLAMICQLWSLGAWAEENQPIELGDIVVTASRSDTKLESMPLHTTVITQGDIQKSPAQTLDQLLRNVPGLLVPGSPYYTTDPTGHNIKFRGMDKKVLVLVDGMPVHDPFFTTIQWNKVPLSSVERVEIIRGGSGMWGNLAVGGVINVISKRPTAGDGEAKASYGSMNTWNGAVTKNFVVSDSVSFTVSGDMFNSDGYNNAPRNFRAAFWPGRGNSSADSKNIRITGFFMPAPDIKGFLRMGYHEQDEDIGGYQYGSNLQKSPDLQASLSKTFDEMNSLQANFWAQWVRFDKYNGAGCYTAPTYACGASISGSGASTAQQASAVLQYATSYDAIDYREQGGSVMYSRESGGLLTSLQVGMDVRAISGEDAQQSYRTPTAALPQVLRIQRTNYGAGEQLFTGVFAQLKFSPWEPVEINLGTRWDSYGSSQGVATQSNYSNVAAPVLQNVNGGAVADAHKSSFNPNVSVRYDITDQLAVRGAAYKAFRAPGLNNMYRTFGSSSISVANPALDPETMTGKEIGVDWKASSFSLGATFFTTDVRNVVATYTLNPGGAFLASGIPQAVQNICGASIGAGAALCTGTVSYYTNGQDQRAEGVELEGKWNISRELSMDAYYTRTSTYYTRTTTGDPTNKQLQLVPKDVAGANLTWRPNDKWSNSFDVRYNGTMTLNLTSGSTAAISQSGYVVFNLNTAHRLNDSLEWYAAANNLFDKEYTDSSASNLQGRSFAQPRSITTGLRARF